MIIREVFVKLLLKSSGKLRIRPKYKLQLVTFMRILRLELVARATARIALEFAPEVDVRTHLLGGAIDSSEANGIIRDPKLELESSRFTFDLVPLSYESVDVIIEENWLLRHKAEMNRISYGISTRSDADLRRLVLFDVFRKARGLDRLQELQGEGWFEWVHKDDVAKTVFRMRNRHVEVYGYAFWVKQCTSGFHGVNEPGGVRVAREDDHGVTKGREDVREVFQRRGSGAKRKISRCGRNQMGNEPILALPEGADDFVVYYDARSKDLEACLGKRRSEYGFEVQYHLGKANVVVESWSRKKSEAKNEFWIDVTVLWAITGEVELNGSNLVQETTNKIVVGYGWLKVSPWRGVVRLERKTS
ncbi:hypothetical protein Tco_0381320 [Tanacetum coccineum]